jgi:hypothetical protein
MSFVTPITYSHPKQYDTQMIVDLRRLRSVFSHLDPTVREQVARAFHSAYPDLLVTATPSGMLSFEKV